MKCPKCGNEYEGFTVEAYLIEGETQFWDGPDCVDAKGASCESHWYHSVECDECYYCGKPGEFGWPNAYTVFCRQKNNKGTTWIGCVRALSDEDAMTKGIAECAEDWGDDWHPSDICCIGLAKGEVDMIHWGDFEC